MCGWWWWWWWWYDEDRKEGEREAGREEKLSERSRQSAPCSPVLSTHFTLRTSPHQSVTGQSENSSRSFCSVHPQSEFYSEFMLTISTIWMIWCVIWSEILHTIIQNYMMKKRLTVIHFVLSHLFLFTMESIFHLQCIITSLIFLQQNVKFWAFLALTIICLGFN